jgi:3-deoxy-D-manno-octulosonic-acid transferase
MSSLLWLFYELGLGLVLLLAGPFLLARRGRHYLPTLGGRLGGPGADEGDGGGGATAGRRPLWLHAVSVGEVGVAATLARALPADLPLLVTTVTPTGQALARKLLGARAAVAYLPFDLRPAVARFWRRHQPAALVLVEGDYWPLLLRQARRRGLPIAVVNGRIGDRSFPRLRRLRRLTALLFAGIDHFGMQTAGDAGRLRQLGIEPGRLVVTGNLKFETAEPRLDAGLAAAFGRLAAGRPLLVAGSTMAGEDEQVLAAFAAAGGGGRALLLLAPRHPERWDTVERLCQDSGQPTVRRSRMATAIAGAGGPAVVLLDSLGELAALYSLAAAAFIGGTLVPTGGHNPLEAARYGVPIAVGPAMHNFREIAERFDDDDAWRRVDDADGLGRAWSSWLADPAAGRRLGERAAALLDANRGALARTVEMLAPLLAAMPRQPPGGNA